VLYIWPCFYSKSWSVCILIWYALKLILSLKDMKLTITIIPYQKLCTCLITKVACFSQTWTLQASASHYQGTFQPKDRVYQVNVTQTQTRLLPPFLCVLYMWLVVSFMSAPSEMCSSSSCTFFLPRLNERSFQIRKFECNEKLLFELRVTLSLMKDMDWLCVCSRLNINHMRL
jgi:hypothetical protein